jgi:hypothetical protein
VRLHELKRELDDALRAPKGWRDLWAPFLSMMRVPVDEEGLLEDVAVLEVAPPNPPYSRELNVTLSRRLALEPKDGATNGLEALLEVSAFWTPLGPLAQISDYWEAVGQGASDPAGGPFPLLAQFVTTVEGSPVIRLIGGADEMFSSMHCHLDGPYERD